MIKLITAYIRPIDLVFDAHMRLREVHEADYKLQARNRASLRFVLGLPAEGNTSGGDRVIRGCHVPTSTGRPTIVLVYGAAAFSLANFRSVKRVRCDDAFRRYSPPIFLFPPCGTAGIANSLAVCTHFITAQNHAVRCGGTRPKLHCASSTRGMSIGMRRTHATTRFCGTRAHRRNFYLCTVYVPMFFIITFLQCMSSSKKA